MTKSNQDKVASPATTKSTRMNRIGHWGRIVVMILSGGFIFPHAMTEDDDIVKQDADKEATAQSTSFLKAFVKCFFIGTGLQN
ncbi:MAG: hypothetical protein NTY16_11105 [Deltaproteobacteria bacterium]|nr:hypothetical protein [Deltaproteobacteria bacterium]